MKFVEIYKDRQNRESKEWKLLLSYIDEVAQSGVKVFEPRKALGFEMFRRITALPSAIKKLRHVEQMRLYGSNLQIIPPEIGLLDSLISFDPYTSYRLHWLPFEIMKCKNLEDSRISTRALFGNFKYRPCFPDLTKQRVSFAESKIRCGICEKEEKNEIFQQYWISLNIATDVVPLLISVCSTECFKKIPKGAANHINYPHKGGICQPQPRCQPYHMSGNWNYLGDQNN
jgi:hypothetical protein